MTDAKIAALEVKVENLEAWADKHECDDDRVHKYANNMAEDILNRIGGIERSAARFEADLHHRNGNDLTTKEAMAGIFKRLQALERMAWIALGGITTLGAVATFFGWQILKQLAR